MYECTQPANDLASSCIQDAEQLHHSHTWQPLIDGSLRSRALEAAHLVTERLSDPDRVLEAAECAIRQSTWPLYWHSSSPSFGFAGVAFVYAQILRCFPGEGWNKVAHQYLMLASQGTHTHPLSRPGFFSGTSGMAAVVSLLNKEDERYQKISNTLNKQLCEQILAYHYQRDTVNGIATAEFDAVNGAAGVLAYLITVDDPDELTVACIHSLIGYLIWLSSFDEEQQRERWYTSAQSLVTESQRLHYPQGWLNCGMSHGIPGPLAALALAWLAGYRIPGQREAITFLSQWIVEHQVPDQWGINWPEAIPAQIASSVQKWKKLPPARSAWCYGAPGVARALWLAGSALADVALQQVAYSAIEGVLRRPVAGRDINAPTLCHGIAGLLTICLHFAHETQSTFLREQIPLLVSQILAHFNPDSLLGFRGQETYEEPIDHPGWLTGSPGTALALLASATAVEPVWSRYLLIA